VEQTFLPKTVSCNCSLTTPVPSTCHGRVFSRAKFDVWAKNLDFKFGRLSEEHWASLRDQYTRPWAGSVILSGSTKLFGAYDGQRDYNLMDFLPVQMRALNGFCFTEEDGALPTGVPYPSASQTPKLYQKTIAVPNCWGTVYEILRSISWTLSDDLDIFYDAFSTDDMAAQVWLHNATVPVLGHYTQAKRRFGDIMFIWLRDKQMQRPVLEHAVLFVDQEIVFEKAGTGDLNPFRLTNLGTVEHEWMPEHLGGLFSWELRRRPDLGQPRAEVFAAKFSLAAATAPDPRWPEFWVWPPKLKREFALGVADNPRNVTAPPLELTLLQAERTLLCSGLPSRDWEPCQQQHQQQQQQQRQQQQLVLV